MGAATEMFFDKLRITVLAPVVRLRTAPNVPWVTSLRKGDVVEAWIHHKRKWISIPSRDNVGLSVEEWRTAWDDVSIELERHTPRGWVAFEEGDWKHLESAAKQT